MGDSTLTPLTTQEFLRRLWVVRCQQVEELKAEKRRLQAALDPARVILQEMGYSNEF